MSEQKRVTIYIRVSTIYSIQKIITRPIYCGYNSFCGKVYKGNFDAIIDIDTFNRVQLLLKRQGKGAGRRRIKELITIQERKKQ